MSYPGLAFDPESHVYRVNGERVPGVSEILKAAGCIPANMKFIDPWYAERGTLVHEATALWDRGVLEESTVDPEVAGYLEAWKGFRHEVGPGMEIVEVEQRGYHPAYRYAGTKDRVVLWDGRRCVLDLKTGGPLPHHALQLAAYAKLSEATHRYGIHLSQNGSWKLQPYEERSDWSVFAGAAAAWWWRSNHGLLEA